MKRQTLCMVTMLSQLGEGNIETSVVFLAGILLCWTCECCRSLLTSESLSYCLCLSDSVVSSLCRFNSVECTEVLSGLSSSLDKKKTHLNVWIKHHNLQKQPTSNAYWLISTYKGITMFVAMVVDRCSVLMGFHQNEFDCWWLIVGLLIVIQTIY